MGDEHQETRRLASEMDSFLRQVQGKALGMARFRVGDPDEAMDIVQDAMIRLVRSYSSRPAQEWKPLFYRILNNRIRDHYRRTAVRNKIVGWLFRSPEEGEVAALERAPGPDAQQPDRQLATADAMSALKQAVGRLPERQQQAFLMRTLEGMDVATTAAAMGCSQGSVKTHLSRAMASLREALGDHWA